MAQPATLDLPAESTTLLIKLLKTHWKALHRIRLWLQRIGTIATAALILTTAERPIC
jgi:hypothetical protein